MHDVIRRSLTRLTRRLRRGPSGRPIKITGIGQLFEYEGELVMLTMVTWTSGYGYELRLNSTREYRNDR